jgi:hypothetical protein
MLPPYATVFFFFFSLLLAFTTCFGLYRGHLQVRFLSINNNIEETTDPLNISGFFNIVINT